MQNLLMKSSAQRSSYQNLHTNAISVSKLHRWKHLQSTCQMSPWPRRSRPRWCQPKVGRMHLLTRRQWIYNYGALHLMLSVCKCIFNIWSMCNGELLNVKSSWLMCVGQVRLFVAEKLWNYATEIFVVHKSVSMLTNSSVFIHNKCCLVIHSLWNSFHEK